MNALFDKMPYVTVVAKLTKIYLYGVKNLIHAAHFYRVKTNLSLVFRARIKTMGLALPLSFVSMILFLCRNLKNQVQINDRNQKHYFA
jgi:hypothetical protein